MEALRVAFGQNLGVFWAADLGVFWMIKTLITTKNGRNFLNYTPTIINSIFQQKKAEKIKVGSLFTTYLHLNQSQTTFLKIHVRSNCSKLLFIKELKNGEIIK